MKKQLFRFITLTLALIVGAWVITGTIQPQFVAAQGNDLDAILARATVKGYMISLKHSSSRSSTLANFYLGETVAQSTIVQDLSQRQVTSFDITAEGWLNDGTYQVTLTIHPDDLILVADVSKVANRWQIVNLTGDDPASMTEGAATAEDGAATTGETTSTADDTATPTDDTSTTTDTATPTGDTSTTTADTPSAVPTGSTATAEIVSFGLNVRAGPGFEYPIQAHLTRGEVVEIMGTNTARRWYQVAREGQMIGWISAKLDYVAPSAGAENVPVVSVPPLPGTENEAMTVPDTPPPPVDDTAMVEAETATTSVDDTAMAEAETATTPADDTTMAAPTEASPTAQVLSFVLNIRSGPGIGYSILGRLTKDEVVDVVGVNAAGVWYQVAREGQVIGWISAKPAYVISSAGTANVPVVPAPPIPGAGSKTSNAPVPVVSTASTPATGSALILQERSGGNFYLVDINGNTLRQLTAGIDPTLSPDGTKVAFTRWSGSSGGDGSVWIYDLTTHTEWQVLGETKQAKSPTWSPDGGQLLVSFQQGGRPVIEERCKNRGGRIPREAYDVNIGSETGRICYKLPADLQWHLRLINVATAESKDMTSGIYSMAPTWDPIQSWRVIFAEVDGLQQLDVNRNVYFPFTTDFRDRSPVISPDGKYVAVTYKQDSHWEVYTISTADGARRRLTKTPILGSSFNSAGVAWSPDSQQLVFVTDRTGQWEFWIMNIDGSNPRPFLSPELAAQLSVEYQGVDERLISWVR